MHTPKILRRAYRFATARASYYRDRAEETGIEQMHEEALMYQTMADLVLREWIHGDFRGNINEN